VSSYKKYFNNPYKFRLYTNSSSDLYNYQMNNLMDGFYDSAMDRSTDGSFKAVCLSGVRTEDNNAGSQNTEDAQAQGEYMVLTVKPLISFGNILPDPASYSTPEEINSVISLYQSMFSARSDYVSSGENMPQFGQIVTCYFEDGSISDSNFSGLRFQEPKVLEVSQRYLNLATIEGVQTATGAFLDGPSGLLGSQEGIDPRYPPREWIYVGSNQTYVNQKLQNGNLPQDLLGRATQGKAKPSMLAELVNGYDRMATDFATRFPGLTLSAWGYRTYERQKTLKVQKPNLAARPGTSNHGWGQAIDIHFYNSAGEVKKLLYSNDQYKWLKENSAKYGWYNPPWASQGGSKEEPWHWEASQRKFKKA
jgi:hypothetical protein